MMPGTREPIVEDLRATLDALVTTSSGSDVTTDLVGRLIAQAAALARVLGVEADAAARATAARLRREVDAAVASADAGPPVTDRHAPWADAAGAPGDAAPAQG
jgi:hypothetical protein